MYTQYKLQGDQVNNNSVKLPYHSLAEEYRPRWVRPDDQTKENLENTENTPGMWQQPPTMRLEGSRRLLRITHCTVKRTLAKYGSL